jgi:lysozyme
MSESLEDRIKRHEGFVAVPKPDAKGAYVVGYGHDIPESEASNYSAGITLEEAENLLSADIQKAEDGVFGTLPWVKNISELRQGVLVEMSFQLGLNGLLGFKNTLAYIHGGDYANAAKGMLNSLWAKQTPERAEELAALMLNGDNIPA